MVDFKLFFLTWYLLIALSAYTKLNKNFLKSFVKFISLFSYFEVEKMTRSKRIVGNILGGFSKDNATSMMKARTDSKT